MQDDDVESDEVQGDDVEDDEVEDDDVEEDEDEDEDDHAEDEVEDAAPQSTCTETCEKSRFILCRGNAVRQDRDKRFCASMRSRNELGQDTRAIPCGNLQTVTEARLSTMTKHW